MFATKKPRKRFHPVHQEILSILEETPFLDCDGVYARVTGYTRSTVRSSLSELSTMGMITWKYANRKTIRGLPPRIFWIPSDERPPEESSTGSYTEAIPDLLSKHAMTAQQVSETLTKSLSAVKCHLSLLKAEGILDSALIPDPARRRGRGCHIYWTVGSDAAPSTDVETVRGVIFNSIAEARKPVSAGRIAKLSGYSITTIRRYLPQLIQEGKVVELDNRDRVYIEERAERLFAAVQP